ncbi:MAG: hypothetical protein ACRC6U_00830 [Fusobacteriaceae bacterium]
MIRKNRFRIPGASKYELHQILKKNSYTWGVWSIKNQIYLKDTTAFGKEKNSELKLVGIVFDDGRREKLYIKKIISISYLHIVI